MSAIMARKFKLSLLDGQIIGLSHYLNIILLELK